jgi:hypothetical protein
VYGVNGNVGVVTQVVIQPEDRIVTHDVIRSSEIKDVKLVAHENIVPVNEIDLVVNEESLFLVRIAPPIGTCPDFDPDEYPLASFTWKAPYPYTAGEVLWPLRQLYEVSDTPPATSLEPVSSELKVDGTRMTAALVSV